MEPSLLVLKTTPDDPAANLEVGEYFCVQRRDWTLGLPMLARGSDEPMKALALKDLAAALAVPTNSHDAQVTGDAWWDLSDHEPAPARKTAMQDRAAFWYRQAMEGATGLEKLKIAKRIGLLPAAGLHLTDKTNTPEANAIVADIGIHYPGVVKGSGELELFRVHDGMELHGGVQNISPGSVAKWSRLASGPGGNGLANVYDTWPAGRYLIVYRVRAFWSPGTQLPKTDICNLDICHDSGTTIAGVQPTAEAFRENEWSSIPVPLELLKDDTIEYRISPNNTVLALDRIYIFRVK